MAFQSHHSSDARGRAAKAAAEPATGLRRILRGVLHALASAHRSRLAFERNRFRPAGEKARPEPEHALSWRFGVPVR